MVKPHGFVLIVLLLCLNVFAAAQVAVKVMDRDLGIPLEGARVKVSGIETVYSTGKDGSVMVDVPKTGRIILRVDSPGYVSVKKELESGQKAVELDLILASALEGSGVVVRGAKPQASDAEAGVSQVVTSQDISQQTMGINEDAFSAVKNLPGVGYTGAFDAKPSINGGDPNETVATLDGAYILNPYQWQGAYTIFNPDMVDSIKLSDGIIPAPYGQVMSGLLEVSSKTATDSLTHVSLDLSTTGVNLFLETPIGADAGLIVAGKTMWLEIPLWLFGDGSLFTTPPYMYDADTKLYWNPQPSVHWTLNFHYDSDGVGNSFGTTSFGLTDQQILVSSTLKLLISDNLLWSVLASYNTFHDELSFQGQVPKDQSLTDSYYDDETEYRYQFKSGFDWNLDKNQVLSFGLDELFDTWATQDQQDIWNLVNGSYYDTHVDVTNQGKNTVETGLYLDDRISLIPEVLKAEAGIRLDHTFVYGGGQLLMTYPVVNPRLLLTYTTLKNWWYLQSMDVFAGSGLYSEFPADNQYLDSSYGVQTLDLGPTRAWFNEVGFEAHGREGESLTLEGFSKYYLDRFYTATANSTDNVTTLKYDGTGYIYGVDFGLKKSTSLWDFSLSYTFTYAQLYNPGGTGLDASSWENPLGVWYAPSYNRYHTFYLTFLYKPSDSFSVLVDGNAASGEVQKDGSRGSWEYPIDVKLDWHGFYSNSHVRWEFYLACQDILAALYYIRTTGAASFDVGIPIPSVGYKLSF